MMIITDTPSSYTNPETRFKGSEVTAILPLDGNRERHIKITHEGVSETIYNEDGEEEGEWWSTHDDLLSYDPDKE